MLNRRFTIAVSFLVVISVLRADEFARAAEPVAPKLVTAVEGITEFRFPNGFKVLLLPDDSKPTVTVNITFLVGSRHEGYGEAGMAHLLEHMVFKGTPTFPQVPKVLKEHGAQYNGTTWLDRTNYYEMLPAGDKNLEFAIHLEADRMLNSYIRAEDLASEMSVVRNEFESGENSPFSILGQRMMAVAYEWHNYGQSTIGNRADIERVPVEKLKVFYKKYYQPDNAVLVVAGQFDPKQALQYVAKYFGSIPRPKRKLELTYTEEPAQDGERFVTLRRVGDISLVGVLYHIPSGAHPDYVAIDVLESILTARPAGRLYKALVETKKAANVYGGAFALHDPGVLRLMAPVTKGNDAQVVLDTMLDVTEGITKDGVTQEEVDRAKRGLLKQVELAASDSGRTARELTEWIAQGDWRLKFLYRDRVEKVTPADVKRVAVDYLRRNNRTVGMFLPVEKPERVAIPATQDLAQMLGDYKGREAVSAGAAFDVSPKNVDDHTERFELADGIKVAFLQKKSRGESVTVRLTLRYGDLSSLKGLKAATELLPDLMVRGTKKLSRQQLQDELDKLQARLGASGQAGSTTFSIQTKRTQLAAVLEILRQVLREPTLPEQEFEVLKNGTLNQLEQGLKDPRSLGIRVLRRVFRPYDKDDPRYEPTIAEEIAVVKAMSRETLQKVYGEFLGAANGELTVVGDFDADALKPIIEKMFAGWKAKHSYARIPQRGDFKIKPATIEVRTPGKANAAYMSGLVFPMTDEHTDYAALVMADYILGGGSLSSRLGDRVRQKDGLSYGVFSHFQALPVDERASITIMAICNPINITKVKLAIREEVDLLLAKGVTDKELAAAKAGYLESRKVGRTQDAALASILASNSYLNRSMDFHAEFEKKIAAVTKEELVSAFRKYIDPNKLVIVLAGDLDKKPLAEETPESKE